MNDAYNSSYGKDNDHPASISSCGPQVRPRVGRVAGWRALGAHHAQTWRKPFAIIASLILMLVCWQAGVAADAHASTVPPQAYQALTWRDIGPFRGGRTTAVAGVASEPYTFYIGSSGGGVWKSNDAGTTWKNISDGYFKVGSIGAIAVAPSNPKVIYVGTGEASVRNHSSSPGDGVYRSTDAGQTWIHVGLNKTLHIASIVVDPNNPKVVYVAAQGNPWEPTKQRGVYRSRDGGKTWKRVLFVNKTSGAHSVSIDPKNPNVVYASMWDHRRKPWHLRSGGPGSGLWKSVDGGGHWQHLTQGLPEHIGISAVSVSPADPNWVYAMVEAVHGGVFRSEDAGAHWKRVSHDPGLRTRAWYYTIITADPMNRGTVYVLGDGGVIGKSTDGGNKFVAMRVPHGDNHALWINPRNNQIMVEGNDGGGTVTLNGGSSWSSEHNQPTGQFYRVFVDNSFPFRLYGSQQDAGTASVPSRTASFRGISVADEYSVGGGESGHIGMNKQNPKFIYATGMFGSTTRYNSRTKQVRNITAYPYWKGFRIPKDMKYRFSWTSPVVVSQFDPSTIYMGAQVVLESTDKGQSWHSISPDLTANNKHHQGTAAGPISIAGGGYQTYDTIVSLATSSFDPNTLWAGSDDGFVHVTRDGGKHWADVTPRAVREDHAYVHSIDVSPTSAGTVYVAANRHRFGDFRPMIYVTHDFGKSWKSIVHGIPGNEFVYVVRQDPKHRDLLYAGTDRGVYVSFDGGNSWQPLQLNLPAVPVSDLRVHGNDLAAATLGRSFWVLDGLDALRQLNAQSVAAKMYLYKPATTYRMNFHFSMLAPGPFGKNPPNGVVIRYSFRKAPDTQDTPVVLQILDPNKKVIRQFTSKKSATAHTGHAFLKGAGFSGRAAPLPTAAGMNSYVWNLRVAPYVRTADVWHYVTTRPYRVAPGTYYARLTYGNESQTRSFKVAVDPNYPKRSTTEWAQQQATLRHLGGLVNTINRSNNQMRSIAQQVDQRMHAAASNGNRSAAECRAAYDVVKQIAKWGQQAAQPPLPNNVQDYNNWPARSFSTPVLSLISSVDQGPPLTAGQKTVAKVLEARWATMAAGMKMIEHGSLEKLNAELTGDGLPAVKVPDGKTASPVVPATVANFCTVRQ